MSPTRRLRLSDLTLGASARVVAVTAGDTGADPLLLRRLGELGFVAGEPLTLLHRGPGGREPLAVQIGETMFALRLTEARCIEIELEPTTRSASAPR